VIWAEPLARPWAGEAEAPYRQGDFLLIRISRSESSEEPQVFHDLAGQMQDYDF
jgi:hypothetical protein